MLEWGRMGREKISLVGIGVAVLLTSFATDDEKDRLGVKICLCDPTGANTLYVRFVNHGDPAPTIDLGGAVGSGYHDTVPAGQSIDFRCSRGIDVYGITDVGNIIVVCAELRN